MSNIHWHFFIKLTEVFESCLLGYFEWQHLITSARIKVFEWLSSSHYTQPSDAVSTWTNSAFPTSPFSQVVHTRFCSRKTRWNNINVEGNNHNRLQLTTTWKVLISSNPLILENNVHQLYFGMHQTSNGCRWINEAAICDMQLQFTFMY